jgi:hypothetical protein
MPVFPAPVYVSLFVVSLVALHLVAIAGFARTGRVGLLLIMAAFLLWPMFSNLVRAFIVCSDPTCQAVFDLQYSGTLLLLVSGLLLLARGSEHDA